MNKINKKIAEELNIKESQVESAVKLIDEGNTIPFIARYRKEATGGLSDEILRDLDDRLKYLRNLEARKEEIIRLIDEQGKLTDELTIKIAGCMILSELEDIYRPYKPPKADTGSQASASFQASDTVSRTAKPHALLCFRIAKAVSSLNSSISSTAAWISCKLL